MKLYTQKILSPLLATSLSLSLLPTSVLASDFSDSNTFPSWAVPYITDAVELGLVEGYTDGTFKPERTMLVGEFLVMLTKSYTELVELSQNSGAEDYVQGAWYSPYVYAAHTSGLFPQGMNPTETDMSQGITREQAAYMVYTAMTTLGGESNEGKTLATSAIKDYSSIGEGYGDAVTQLYLFGIMGGTSVDAQEFSTFSPQNQLTRSQLCVIMLALNEADRRQPYEAPEDQSSNSDNYSHSNPDFPEALYNKNGQQIIYEGQSYERPLAVEGDIVIDKDGNEVVLVVGPSGVLGEGQGVAADLGLKWPTAGQVIEGGSNVSVDKQLDSLGNFIAGQKYWINNLTGEGHWSGAEWSAVSPLPSYDGSFKWELSPDSNWFWGGDMWGCVYSQRPDWSSYDIIREANGLT